LLVEAVLAVPTVAEATPLVVVVVVVLEPIPHLQLQQELLTQLQLEDTQEIMLLEIHQRLPQSLQQVVVSEVTALVELITEALVEQVVLVEEVETVPLRVAQSVLETLHQLAHLKVMMAEKVMQTPQAVAEVVLVVLAQMLVATLVATVVQVQHHQLLAHQ
jgi:hypothetical protein